MHALTNYNNPFTYLTALIVFILSSPATAAVIFEDNFNTSPDWQSNQTISKSMPTGVDIGWPSTYFKTCGTNRCPPQGWTSYRAASSQWTDDRRRDTYILNSAGARGGSGKGITFNIESRGEYGLWAGGSLDLWLGKQGYNELYARMYIKYSDEWTWSDGAHHGQQKLIRISTYNEDIETTTHNPQEFGSGSVNWPVWYPDWYYNYVYKFSYFMSSTRTAPTYITDGDTNYTSVKWPTDAAWHCYEYHVKMNSALNVADGIWELYIDGVKVSSRNNVNWKQTGASDTGWNWLMVLDNVTVAPYPASQNKEMSIFMDDIVVSTSYIGTDYTITDKIPTNPLAPSPVKGFIYK